MSEQEEEEEMSELEKVRAESIRLINEMHVQEMGDDGSNLYEGLPIEKKQTRKRKRRQSNIGFRTDPPPPLKRSKRQMGQKRLNYADTKEQSVPKFHPIEHVVEDKDYEVISKRPKIFEPRASTSFCPRTFTRAELARVATRQTVRIYSDRGTTCHQCRQKTLDTKTVCQNRDCVGVRGQFCGICLKNRYGEDATAALRNIFWECPPCRGICNCSTCRTKQGKGPTGVLTPQALAHGHKSVKDFLGSLQGIDEPTSLATNTARVRTPLTNDLLGFTDTGNSVIVTEQQGLDCVGFRYEQCVATDCSYMLLPESGAPPEMLPLYDIGAYSNLSKDGKAKSEVNIAAEGPIRDSNKHWNEDEIKPELIQGSNEDEIRPEPIICSGSINTQTQTEWATEEGPVDEPIFNKDEIKPEPCHIQTQTEFTPGFCLVCGHTKMPTPNEQSCEALHTETKRTQAQNEDEVKPEPMVISALLHVPSSNVNSEQESHPDMASTKIVPKCIATAQQFLDKIEIWTQDMELPRDSCRRRYYYPPEEVPAVSRAETLKVVAQIHYPPRAPITAMHNPIQPSGSEGTVVGAIEADSQGNPVLKLRLRRLLSSLTSEEGRKHTEDGVGMQESRLDKANEASTSAEPSSEIRLGGIQESRPDKEHLNIASGGSGQPPQPEHHTSFEIYRTLADITEAMRKFLRAFFLRQHNRDASDIHNTETGGSDC